MATKEAQKPEFPETVYVWKEMWDDDETLLASETPGGTVGVDDSERVGVYQLVRVVTVTWTKTVTVEE